MSSPCIAGIEIPHISIAFLAADAAVTASPVTLLGLEPVGIETLVVRLAADSLADLEAAVEAAERAAENAGARSVGSTIIPRPDAAMAFLNAGPNSMVPLYNGRAEMRADDYSPNLASTMNNEALGILETQGLAASLEATDAMLKSANVRLIGKEKIGAAYVAVMIRGDVAAVRAAIDSGAEAVGDIGKLIAAHVIARPHDDMLALLPAEPTQNLER